MTASPRASLFLAFAECFASTQHGLLAGPPLWMMTPARDWPLNADASHFATESPAARRAILSLSEIPAESLERRRERYDSLFNGTNGRPCLWLYESAARTGRILGPETFAVAKLYCAAGLEPNFGAELPDHASLELAFLAHLAEQSESDIEHAVEWRALEWKFLKEHGDWLTQLGRALANSDDEVYMPIGAFLADWLTESGQKNISQKETARRPPSTGHGLLPTIPCAEDCTLCGFCVQVCPAHALAVRENESDTLLVLNAPLCIGCGKCERICETKAITLVSDSPQPITPNSQPVTCNIALHRSPRAVCPSCGKPTVSRAELDYVSVQLGSPAWLDYCLDCRPQFYGG